MKYAAKPQKLNPEKPTNAKDWEIWDKIEFDSDVDAALKAQGWTVSNSDNLEEVFFYQMNCPKEITPRQARQILTIIGISNDFIISKFDMLPEPTKSLAKIEWEYSNAIQRNNPLVAQMGLSLGFTDHDLNKLFYNGAML